MIKKIGGGELKARFGPDLEAKLQKSKVNVHDILSATTIWDEMHNLIKEKNKELSKECKNRIVNKKCYRQRMMAFKDGAPEKLLLNDYISRQIVRALYKSRSHKPLLGVGFGEEYDASQLDTLMSFKHDLVVFPKVEHEEIKKRIELLMQSGLLNYNAYSKKDGNYAIRLWCFESEAITTNDKKSHEIRFVKNYKLRKTLEAALKPFEGERNVKRIYEFTRDIKEYYSSQRK